jgi:DNA topoisomerase-1
MTKDKNLVIVESPAKANTLSKFLGSAFVVEASGGHVRDLPRTKLGVEIDKSEFKPRYVLIPQKKKIVARLKEKVKDCAFVYLAADPDREGEAICWHLSKVLCNGKTYKRVLFYEITKEAVLNAFKSPAHLNQYKINAQQARRILDRIVGYELSPLLWKKVSRGLSAGRVQSVAVRLIVEREKEIKQFKPQEYWELEALLKKRGTHQEIRAKLQKINDKKPQLKNEEEILKLVEHLKSEKFIVSELKESTKKKNPTPPYTTSKLQQEAFNTLRFSASKTMRIAQQLYEGIEIEDSLRVGLITYMRTDSVRVSEQALESVRKFIEERFGKEFLPEKPYYYKTKAKAQAAHEAIRPTYISRTPESLSSFLTKDQLRLYTLIWKKFISSQMSPALILTKRIDISAGNCLFVATASFVKFPGCLILYQQEKDQEKTLPKVKVGEVLELISLTPSQHFTQPPPRYTEASLVKALEEKGIGRPSTYAPIIQTILGRHYVGREANYLVPTDLGIVVTELLLKHFPDIMDIKFTARMEEELDAVEEGQMDWQKVLWDFYNPFMNDLETAKRKMREVKKEIIETDELCPRCHRPLVIKWGRRGKFLSCSGFPECDFSKSISLGVICPKCKTGEVVTRKTKKGRFFYGCSRYPECDFTSNRLPEKETDIQKEHQAISTPGHQKTDDKDIKNAK